MSFNPPSFGWVQDPIESARVASQIEAEQGYLYMSQVAPHLDHVGDGKDVFFWEIEERLFGKRLSAWNQNPAGTCVGFGWARACQDLLVIQIAQVGSNEGWEAEVAIEPIYGGSRVEVGGGRISASEDGSVGAWAAKWVKDWGVLLRKVYGSYDLTKYSIPLARSWGGRGVPDDLEPEARKHPVKGVVLVESSQQALDLLASYKPIAICGSKGRSSQRRPGGWCPVEGTWYHCQMLCGKCEVVGGSNGPFGGDGAFPYAGTVSAIVYRNSWHNTPGYLDRGNATVNLASGRTVELPDQCYLSHPSECESEFRQRDSFAISDAVGWTVPTFSWDV